MEFLFAIRATLAQRSAFVLEIRHTYGWFLILLLHCLSSLSELLNHDFVSVINIHTWHTWLLLQLHAIQGVPCIAVYFMNVSHSFHFCQNLLVLEMEVESADFFGLSGSRSVAEIHVEVGAERIHGFVSFGVVECAVLFIALDGSAQIEIAWVATGENHRIVVANKLNGVISAVRGCHNIVASGSIIVNACGRGIGHDDTTKNRIIDIVAAFPFDDIKTQGSGLHHEQALRIRHLHG